MTITKEDFISWKDNSVTKKLLNKIKSEVEYMKNLLVYQDQEGVKELQERIKASQIFVDIEFEDLE
jgi:DNA-binding transcriptional regulator GbsR (MarR family)